MTALLITTPAPVEVAERAVEQLPKRHSQQKHRQGDLHLGCANVQLLRNYRERWQVEVDGERR